MTTYKPEPHAAMLHTHDGTFQSPCNVLKLHTMSCDAFSNMLVISLPILKPIFLLSDS